MSDATPLEPLLPPEEAAKILNLSTSWLAKARMTGDGPEYVQIGRAIRYTPTSLLQFIAKRTRKATKQRNNERPDGKGRGAND
jgi:hypothetical protein